MIAQVFVTERTSLLVSVTDELQKIDWAIISCKSLSSERDDFFQIVAVSGLFLILSLRNVLQSHFYDPFRQLVVVDELLRMVPQEA